MKIIITEDQHRDLGATVLKDKLLSSGYMSDLKKELSFYKSSEELLRSGGLSSELLHRLAFGFSVEDVKQINPINLKIRWKDDLEQVKHEIRQSGLSPKEWARGINLSEPIDVDYWEEKGFQRGFYIQDGHHRYMAAKILSVNLNVNITIKVNPIKVLTSDMGYDEFHRAIFDMFEI